MLHEECYRNFVRSYESSHKELLCPICRTPIDKAAVSKQILKSNEPDNTDPATVFALQDAAPVDGPPLPPDSPPVEENKVQLSINEQIIDAH